MIVRVPRRLLIAGLSAVAAAVLVPLAAVPAHTTGQPQQAPPNTKPTSTSSSYPDPVCYIEPCIDQD